MFAVTAERGDQLALARVVEVCKAGVVELQIRAPETPQAPHLLSVRGGEVIPEPGQVRVHRLVDRRASAAVVHHARRRDRELWYDAVADVVLQEAKVVGEDGLAESHAFVDTQCRGGEIERAAIVEELHMQL